MVIHRLDKANVRRGVSFIGMMLGILLLGCSPPGAAIPHTPDTSANSPVSVSSAKQGQMLPISATAMVAGKVIHLEVAKTPQQQEIGLMYRTSLPDDRGMLFTFDPPQSVMFWMKNTLISLDMVFLRQGVVQAIAPSVPPCRQEPCPTYGPNSDIIIDQVIELRAGLTAELGLKEGSRITIQPLDANPKSPTSSGL